jgi:FtsP/CotA-like multicopper oxidase with cupredoxin domain
MIRPEGRDVAGNFTRGLCLIAAFVACTATQQLAAGSLPAIIANDNRAPAGELRNGILTLHLEVGEGQWHPESEEGEAIPIYAFGEAGRPLQNPGPLIRMPQGTEVQGTVHNALPVAVTLHGLHERPGEEKDAFTLQPGATQEFRFKAGAPGTYFYWGTTTGSAISQRKMIETQLAGALVIDPPGVVAKDRVFVLGLWGEDVLDPTFHGVAAINGKSWPYTERFTFQVGETVHWRWLNPSDADHAMHLHGFYYHVDAAGDGERNEVYNASERPLVVTQHVNQGETFDMTWVPERSGRWVFHCHMLRHMSQSQPRLTASSGSDHNHAHGGGPEAAGMGGLVIGITVVADKPEPKPPVWQAERELQLIIAERSGGRPLYALEVRDTAQASPQTQKQEHLALIGPPIVLRRGQPVEIEVVNRTKQPTAIHWHGIELESYYDGVAGWTGTAGQTTPAILPGESFVARMAPPRAGTFIYHTHWHERAQLTNGIYGPLIVVPLEKDFDLQNDKTFLFSLGSFAPFGEMLLVNGSPQPFALRLKTGTKYRFRLINIAPDNAAMRVSLRQAGVPVQWLMIAKDGADLPPAAAMMKTAEMGITVGETYDVEYEADTPQELSIEVYLPGPKLRATQGLVFVADRPRN